METYVPSGGSNEVVVCLTPLGMEYDGYAERQTIIDANPDKIVIFNNAWERKNLLDELESLGVSSDADIQVYTASSGDSHSFLTAEVLNNNGYHTSNIVIMDPAYNFNKVSNNLTYETAKNLADNGTSVLVACQSTRTYVNNEGLDRIIAAGVKLSYIHIYRDDYTWDQNHSYVKNNLIENGVIGVLFGEKAKFDNGIYANCEYSIYDYATNTWKDNLTIDEFCNYIRGNPQSGLLDKKYRYLSSIPDLDASIMLKLSGHNGVVSSDQEFITNKMNEIRGDIRKTNFIGKLESNVETIGDNPVLSLESTILMGIFDTSGVLLDKLVRETENISTIAFDFAKLDDDLSLMSKDIDA